MTRCKIAHEMIDYIENIVPDSIQISIDCWERNFHIETMKNHDIFQKIAFLEELHKYLEDLQIPKKEEKQNQGKE